MVIPLLANQDLKPVLVGNGFWTPLCFGFDPVVRAFQS